MTNRLVRPAPIDPEKPKLGVLPIRDPADGQRLPEGGKVVAWSDFWARREADGDIAVEDVPPEPKAGSAARAPETKKD